MGKRTGWRLALPLLLIGLAAAPPVGAQGTGAEHLHGDVLLFLSGEGIARTARDASSPFSATDYLSVADLFISHSAGRFRFLSEAVLSTAGDHEFERLQVGWALTENVRLWAGRFHQPASAWNTEHHHGQYLQTAITQPAIELWEDSGGIMPQHITGLLLETLEPLRAGAGLAFSVGLGKGPGVRGSGLDPLPVLRPNESGHQNSYTARLAYLPDMLGPSSFGVLAAHHEFPILEPLSVLPGINHADLTIYGGYADLQRARWRLIGTLYYLQFDPDGAASPGPQHFPSGYLQLERQISANWIAYGRQENSIHASDALLLKLHQADFPLHRTCLGLRWNVARHQALTLEAAALATRDDTFGELRLQWSGVLN